MAADHEGEHALNSGDIIAGKYRVEREIGRGGMGVVVAATHIDLDQRVAIKILQRSSAFNQDAMARFLREARSAAKIRSEHVARVMDVGKLDDGLTYIVMEHLEGADLADVLRKEGPLRITTAADYVLQACEGIAAAHAAGIIHRDIKPANLFLARQPGRANIIKILDFGVSKVSKTGLHDKDASATQTGQVFGSPMYMSPEQLDSTIAIDCRTDIWALGVVLFELLTGKPPFDGKSSANIMTAVIRDPPPKLRSLRPDAPATLEEVIDRCLEKEREDRYATVIDLAEAIAPFCGKGADETVNRIYLILAHAAGEEPESTNDTTMPGESRTKIPSGQQSNRRGSGPQSNAANPSFGGASRTHGEARKNPTRRAIVMAVAGAATLATIGTLVLRREREPTPASTPNSPSAAVESTPALAPTPSIAPSGEVVAVKPPVLAEVTIVMTGAPKGAKVFRGDKELGTAAAPLRFPRSDEKITLRFVAETFAPAEIALIPNVDQTLAVTMKPAPPGTTAPNKPRVPKELEPF